MLGALPRMAKLGIGIVLIGLGMDAVVHMLPVHDGQVLVAGFSIEEHASHLVVVLGMVIVIAGVMIEGSRLASRRPRAQRRESDAIR
jgi:hypothetical protein